MEKIKLTNGGVEKNNDFRIFPANQIILVDGFVSVMKTMGVSEICSTLVSFPTGLLFGFAILTDVRNYLYFGLEKTTKNLLCCRGSNNWMQMFNSKRNMCRQLSKYFDIDSSVSLFRQVK